ncbi:uncharacterized protein LOC132185783 [Corylus avellana]|uniref:uncharacterized protein LOC132185783 n=1 Tax=Corylus avellana TaxID=13451 RepID=UPI001E23549D|nr:uncharacterized protein LOC132185783 [Corylus avellana]
MSRGRGKSGGWAAFDLKQRQKQGLEPDILNEPFPPLVPCLANNNNDNDKPSSSSLLLPSVDFPALADDQKHGKYQKPAKTLVGDSRGTSSNKENDRVLAVPKLQELHPWADNSLLQDVLAAADNNMDRASTLLKAMVANYDGFEDHGPTSNAEMDSSYSVPLGNTMTTSRSLADIEDSLKYNGKELVDENDCFGEKLSDEAIDQKFILERLKSMPVEPEWEEDDLYLIHRKDALKTMRSASQHSRAATNAFQRDDHASAQHHSLKARQHWSAAERLNAKAAKEILSIRNGGNDLWKLDLHGLHAAEAIQALQERLQEIETQVHPNHSSVFPKGVSESSTFTDAEKLDIPSRRQRPTSLQVITGVGNHSRGHAAIPTAVRSYLNENRYHFDELRPGVVTVRPKFRHR